jgi:predicted transcriptional regulator
MSRLTLRLPDSLHRQLEQLANNESVSLNQYIVYALTRQITLAYTVQAVPEKAIAEQRAVYSALLQNLGEASFDEIKKVLDKREKVKPEKGLTPDIIERVRRKIEKAK